MVTITRHAFINIFQTEHFSAVNLPWVMRKIIYELSCDTRIFKSWEKNEKMGWALKLHGRLVPSIAQSVQV